ncbi:hypothetical protein BB559_001843 [Furculomyces boomerangus]|uniref:Rhodanese domain-containing protein n=2 Tax=Harpellales TaxID=61421 RepID=A0A2T9Z0B4_9FUNG|nr:hypothetical protein BB559_001843 [Furculomyces boomerangus]PWA03774.1 hypothetical protein BB558_000048 [Smittium angustum]
MNVLRIEVSELAKIVRNKTLKPGIDYLVVDVRDNDFIGGHIPGAINVPAYEIRDKAVSLVREYCDIPMIVFHCALSQARGPKSARIYSEISQQLSISSSQTSDSFVLSKKLEKQKIMVLTGGFTTWYYKYKNDPSMIEDADHSLWE